MSSRYQILGDRPIDQWRVTELKEELKRRKLTTRGLKEDLVKRLDEALRIERANTPDEAYNGFNSDPQPIVEGGIEKSVPVVAETVKDAVDHGSSGIEKGSGVKVQVDINDRAAALGHGGVQGRDILVEEEPVIQTATVQNEITVTKTVVCDVPLIGQDLQSLGQEEIVNSNIQVEYEDLKPQVEDKDPKPQVESEGPKPQGESEGPKPQVEIESPKLQLENDNPKALLESVGSKPQLENDDLKPQLENECLKAPHEDDMRDSSTPNNQVSEVSTILGFQVKSDSISTDSVSINEKIELKDNIIADNVKLDLDVVKLEMVEPSSSNVVPISGESHPMDVEEPLENKVIVDEGDNKNVTNADMANKNDSAGMGYSEKLNLDRSSGDDSMEEDVLESKQIDSKCSTGEMGEQSEKNEVSIIKDEGPVGVVGDGLSADKEDVFVENKSCSSVPAEKRKTHYQEAVGNNEPSKRRKWNSERIKVPEQQGSNLVPTTTPKDTTHPPAFKRNFSRSDSSASEDTPKDRVVPPSQKLPTTSLRIDNFLRPFTLKAVQELLGKTGTVTSFWMDHIKTHCYVTYLSVEEAIETRNAVYNLQWPPNGGRLLVADFVDPQEVKIRLEAPPQTPTTPRTSGSTASQAQPTSQRHSSPRQQVSRQQLPPPSALPPPPPLSNPPQVRERLPLPPPPPEKLDPPIVTLDDLFRKTKATPRIYYLPLSEEQVAAKRAAHGRNTKQSAGVAFWKELFQPCGGNLFGDGFWFSDSCFGLSFKFCFTLESFKLKAILTNGLILLCSKLVFLLNNSPYFYEESNPYFYEESNFFWMMFCASL
ncbi:apoptotic chromatin condensation inducer in the nucleus-like [Durio zibethinus]|uniref:Apoptotic chromatin condensation inducer in the nucleus-like n=1 Tax=Durio zibethinus TaxID=66656 RepID=A0A6P6BCU7_DURZI|nr:apoptotic chromatin condensation inducer in the nucleus-like [Durio zibethinus]XP_022774927.1 apoptotic chromatin condensation inducer in the nucleus-like [Durio zibethinus]